MDYFGDYSFKGLPSPADTPYETPDFIRSKRSSRATVGSSREQSASPPPLPPDASELKDRARDGRYGTMDPRRFTPTLHASLVSEILKLRGELDSKNHLVENLETHLSSAKADNETLAGRLSDHVKEVRKAKLQVQQMEKGTYDAVEDLAKQRDTANNVVNDLRTKLDAAQQTTRRQDEDAERTQRIWESEKERWDNERRQLERRVHVTESRLRTVVDEMSAQQAMADSYQSENADDSTFKDSGLGNESDTASIQSVTPVKHRRNISSLSSRPRSIRFSMASRNSGTPEPFAKMNGYSLADELGIDEEDEYDVDEFEHPDEELEFAERVRKTMESRQSSVTGELDSKAKRVLGLTTEIPDPQPWNPTAKERRETSIESASTSAPSALNTDHTASGQPPSKIDAALRVQYVDNGYQPSPPPSPSQAQKPSEPANVPVIHEPETIESRNNAPTNHSTPARHPLIISRSSPSPISPPETPVVDGRGWPDGKRMSFPKPDYTTASTQTEHQELPPHKAHNPNRDSLSPPSFVPSIAIHPPSSRPSSPRPYVLPPGTRNASTQASLPWQSRDAAVQTEGIRVDKRPFKLPPDLLPSKPTATNLLPSPTLQEPPRPREIKKAERGGTAKIFTKNLPSAAPLARSPPPLSPTDTNSVLSRDGSSKDLRSMPLRAIPLPRPVLTPLEAQASSEGPLNRSIQYGVSKAGPRSSQLLDMDKELDGSEGDDFVSDIDTMDMEMSLATFSRPPQGRFGLSEPPKAVPEDKEISPERRPGTADSDAAAPAPSVASSRAPSRNNSHRDPGKQPLTLNAMHQRARSPSFGSMASSLQSSQSAAPPFPIPSRSSSRVTKTTQAHSEGSQSPVPYTTDVFGNRAYRSYKAQHVRSGSLRKVQSAAVIRNSIRKGSSPQKSRRRRRRSPDLTPVQSMAFESPPITTDFPIPELPTPLQNNANFDFVKGSMDIGRRSNTVATATPRMSEETKTVDAIASTMVGEWMWKYIRKRKSFGVQEDYPVAEDGSIKTSSHGSRHKRWVWLSPYERTVMWDSKQPASGTALLGKKGRKLAIQSVLDVVDTTPLPKNPELKNAFGRSIIVLTSERALKFTTVSAQRHDLWMTALSFLAQSGRLPSQIPPMPKLPQPPVIPQDAAPTVKRHRSPSFGRATVRDSIRVAKGKRPELPKSLSHPLDTGRNEAMIALEGGTRNESADFPAVPRLYIGTSRHQRKRSNTSPRLPQPLSTFRNFSSSAVASSTSSGMVLGSTNGSSFRPSASSKSGSRPGSTSLASPDRPNFFEAVGTVRMEAFVDPNVRNGVLYVPAPPLAGGKRMRGDSNISQSTVDKRRAGYVFDENGLDPFKGF